MRDEEAAEEGLKGQEDEMEASAEPLAVEGEDGGEEAACREVDVAFLRRRGVRVGLRDGGGDDGHGVVDVPLGCASCLR